MKILYLIDSLKMGGKERQLIELLKGLKHNKFMDIELVVMDKKIDYYEVHNLNIKINYLIRSKKKDIKIFYMLYKICKAFKPDIIHAWDSMTATYALLISKWFKIKIINGSIRNATPLKIFSFGWFLKLTFPYYDKTISNSLAGLIQYNISKINGHYIHNGFDFNRIIKIKPIKEIKNKLGIHHEKVVGMVASFTKKKDWGSFLESAKIILSKRDDVVFLAVGNGPLLEKMKLLMGKVIKGNILFLSNYRPVEEIINIFNVGVLTTDTDYHKEGISNSIMEYMALGKPVVATNCGGNCELVLNGKSGFLIQNKSPEELTKNILVLLDKPKKSEAFGKTGEDRIRRHFNQERMINNYLNLYRGLCP